MYEDTSRCGKMSADIKRSAPFLSTSHRHHFLLHHITSLSLTFLTTSLPQKIFFVTTPFLTFSLRHHLPSSPISHCHHFPSSPPFLTTSLCHHPSSPHFPPSPLPFLTFFLYHHFPPPTTTPLGHHFPASPFRFITIPLRHHFLSFLTASLLHHPVLQLLFCYVLLFDIPTLSRSIPYILILLLCSVVYCYGMDVPITLHPGQFHHVKIILFPSN